MDFCEFVYIYIYVLELVCHVDIVFQSTLMKIAFADILVLDSVRGSATVPEIPV